MKVTFVVGPTASGKSELALRWAQESRGVIVNCDSVQVYSEVSIGAAKPSPEELSLVPHYLLGHVLPPQDYTAGDYCRDFHQLLPQLESQGVEDVFVVGGTGFYFQAIEKGMYHIEKVADDLSEELREIAATPEGLRLLWDELHLNDPDSAALIHPNDQYRVVRAMEILRGTGTKPSTLKQEMKQQLQKFPYPLRKVGVNWERAVLHQRIHSRVKKMLAAGLIDEVRELNKKGLSLWAPLQSVGYKEVQQYLGGELPSLAALEERILISTRQLAKRQITWFRRDPELRWIQPSSL